MNWEVLIRAVVLYSGVFLALGAAAGFGGKLLRTRFRELFGKELSEAAVDALPADERARWERYCRHDYRRTPYGWLEVASLLFNTPGIMVLGGFLRMPVIPIIPLYLVNGAVYVPLAYLLLR